MADLEFVQHGAVLTIRLARPDKKNALTDTMYRDIATALSNANQDITVAAVIIEGEGPDFCAGNDMATLHALANGEVRLDDLHTNAFLKAISTFGKPLLAGVTGRAIGVGATLLLHCDVVYAAHDAKLSFPFADMALVPEAGSAYLLTARIGYARAYGLLCMAEPISGQEAAAIGLISASFPQQEVSAQIGIAAARLTVKSVAALQATKASMKDAGAIEAALAKDQQAFLTRLATPEVSELMQKQLKPKALRSND